MSSKDKTRRATAAAESALTAARKAAKLSKTLSDKQATKLAPLIKDAKKAGTVTKKQLEDRPRRIERAATEAILALADATAKAEHRRATAGDGKKSDGKKSDAKKSDGKKSDAKKSDGKKSDGKKSDGKKSDGKKSDGKKSDGKKSDAKRSDAKKSDAKKSDAKKIARKKRSAPVPAVPATTDSPRPAETSTATLAAPTVLQNLTVAALRARAKAEGRVGYSRLSKAELIALFV